MKTQINYSKRYKLSVIFIICLYIGIIATSCDPVSNQQSKSKEKDSFSFVFMTDIHLQPELNANQGFTQAIQKINSLKPDFVLTGGDLIMDALAENYEHADSLYNMYDSACTLIQAPVYNTIGNHDLFGVYKASGVDSTHPEYGTKMFEKRHGAPYYSFEHKGWHFIVLNTIFVTPERRYTGMIDSVQMEWIKNDLSHLDASTPIAISVHIPFITSLSQVTIASTKGNSPGLVVKNSKEVLDLFDGYNLKLLLQGHLHYLEDINVRNEIHFITGGAIAGGWWKGKFNDTEEGFLHMHISGEDVSWKYIDYGWEVEESLK